MPRRQTDLEALFDAARVLVGRLYGPGDQAEEITIHTRTGRRIRLNAPLPPPAPEPAGARHGPDFRSVNWFGQSYHFGESEALAVKVLWEAWEAGTPDVGDRTLLAASGASATRLADVFRGNPAWGTLITEGGSRGTHRLADPPA